MNAKLQDLELYDFDKLAKKTKKSREQKRYLAFAHIKEGKTFTEAAKMVRTTFRTMMNWVKKYREQGVEGLKDDYNGGPTPTIPKKENEKFKQFVIELQNNRKGGRIRGKDIQELIKEKYGSKLSLSGVYCILQKVGLVWITGRPCYNKANKEEQEAFKKTLKILF